MRGTTMAATGRDGERGRSRGIFGRAVHPSLTQSAMPTVTQDVHSLAPTDPTPVFCGASTGTPDPAAVFSILQFGAIVPPLSPWQGVARVVPGTRNGMPDPVPAMALRDETPDAQAAIVTELLDRALRDVLGDGPDPVVLFSGGVDSGLLAARLAAMGRKDTLLINYSFGPDDQESHLAERMARHLGLRFERVGGSRPAVESLETPGQVWPQPFGDHTTVAASELAHVTLARLQAERRVVLDGTGADGAFALGNKIASLQQMFCVPTVARRIASAPYRLLWHRPGRVEHISRVLRRSVTMPPLSAVLAQNPLAGILYDDTHASRVHRLLAEWIGGWAGASLPRQVVGADLALTCANTYAPKNLPIFQRAGVQVVYPFLQPEMVRLALSAVESWRMTEPKAVLKQMLAQSVPAEMVYRPKSGFTDPRSRVFYDPTFLGYLRDAARPDAPVAGVVHAPAIRRAADALARGAILPYQTLNAIWAITFTDRWYRTA